MSADGSAVPDENAPPIGAVPVRKTRLQRLRWPRMSLAAVAAPLFALVSTRDVWIEANFKEVQLARMRPGQVATVEIDRYPGRRFSAEVTSVSPSTGSQFSLLPPENATGNWVKVVQRVPVRVQLTHVDAGFLLQAGLSANVTVDAHSRDRELAAATRLTSAGTVLR
jgi:membrane fusion protein, multidrug efflux system